MGTLLSTYEATQPQSFVCQKKRKSNRNGSANPNSRGKRAKRSHDKDNAPYLQDDVADPRCEICDENVNSSTHSPVKRKAPIQHSSDTSSPVTRERQKVNCVHN